MPEPGHFDERIDDAEIRRETALEFLRKASVPDIYLALGYHAEDGNVPPFEINRQTSPEDLFDAFVELPDVDLPRSIEIFEAADETDPDHEFHARKLLFGIARHDLEYAMPYLADITREEVGYGFRLTDDIHRLERLNDDLHGLSLFLGKGKSANEWRHCAADVLRMFLAVHDAWEAEEEAGVRRKALAADIWVDIQERFGKPDDSGKIDPS